MKAPKNKKEPAMQNVLHPHGLALDNQTNPVLPKQGRGRISSDVLGSYTGTPEDGGMPIQDADDL